MGPAIVRFPRRHVDPNAVYELVMRERSADGRHGSSIPFSFRARFGLGLTNARVAESGRPEVLIRFGRTISAECAPAVHGSKARPLLQTHLLRAQFLVKRANDSRGNPGVSENTCPGALGCCPNVLG